MPMSNAPPEPWHSFFRALDAAVEEEVRLECIGGFVVTAVHGMLRTTGDVDVVNIVVGGGDVTLRSKVLELGRAGGDLYRRHGVYLEMVGIAPLAYEYEDRLQEVFPGAYRHLRLLAADPYDVALAKIERDSPRDQKDVFYLAQHIPFDLHLLRERYEREVRPYLGVPRREDLTLKLWIEEIEDQRREIEAQGPARESLR